MTPMERLQAAIETLEKQRAQCQWEEVAPLDYSVGHVWGVTTVPDPSDQSGQTPMAEQVQLASTSSDGARLIVTLYRTIDAQLAIMRAAAERGAAAVGAGGIERFVWSREHRAVALADAILGSTS